MRWAIVLAAVLTTLSCSYRAVAQVPANDPEVAVLPDPAGPEFARQAREGIVLDFAPVGAAISADGKAGALWAARPGGQRATAASDLLIIDLVAKKPLYRTSEFPGPIDRLQLNATHTYIMSGSRIVALRNQDGAEAGSYPLERACTSMALTRSFLAAFTQRPQTPPYDVPRRAYRLSLPDLKLLPPSESGSSRVWDRLPEYMSVLPRDAHLRVLVEQHASQPLVVTDHELGETRLILHTMEVMSLGPSLYVGELRRQRTGRLEASWTPEPFYAGGVIKLALGQEESTRYHLNDHPGVLRCITATLPLSHPTPRWYALAVSSLKGGSVTQWIPLHLQAGSGGGGSDSMSVHEAAGTIMVRAGRRVHIIQSREIDTTKFEFPLHFKWPTSVILPKGLRQFTFKPEIGGARGELRFELQHRLPDATFDARTGQVTLPIDAYNQRVTSGYEGLLGAHASSLLGRTGKLPEPGFVAELLKERQQRAAWLASKPITGLPYLIPIQMVVSDAEGQRAAFSTFLYAEAPLPDLRRLEAKVLADQTTMMQQRRAATQPAPGSQTRPSTTFPATTRPAATTRPIAPAVLGAIQRVPLPPDGLVSAGVDAPGRRSLVLPFVPHSLESAEDGSTAVVLGTRRLPGDRAEHEVAVVDLKNQKVLQHWRLGGHGAGQLAVDAKHTYIVGVGWLVALRHSDGVEVARREYAVAKPIRGLNAGMRGSQLILNVHGNDDRAVLHRFSTPDLTPLTDAAPGVQRRSHGDWPFWTLSPMRGGRWAAQREPGRGIFFDQDLTQAVSMLDRNELPSLGDLDVSGQRQATAWSPNVRSEVRNRSGSWDRQLETMPTILQQVPAAAILSVERDADAPPAKPQVAYRLAICDLLQGTRQYFPLHSAPGAVPQWLPVISFQETAGKLLVIAADRLHFIDVSEIDANKLDPPLYFGWPQTVVVPRGAETFTFKPRLFNARQAVTFSLTNPNKGVTIDASTGEVTFSLKELEPQAHATVAKMFDRWQETLRGTGTPEELARRWLAMQHERALWLVPHRLEGVPYLIPVVVVAKESAHRVASMRTFFVAELDAAGLITPAK